MTEATKDRVVGRWSAKPQLHQAGGVVHGGAHSIVVETLTSVGAALWFQDSGTVVGVNNSMDFYAATAAGELTSVASPIHRDRTQQVWVVETTDDGGRLLARGQVRLQNLPR